MLRNLQIKNFKGWRDTLPIKMSPLTVFFGTNSSGKSSIEQFLLMLKQTVDSSDRKMVI
jgi:predicted ATPase